MQGVPEAVVFSPDGTNYALLAGSSLHLHDSPGPDTPTATFSHPSRALCLAHASQDLIATGAEDGSLRYAARPGFHPTAQAVSQASQALGVSIDAKP